MTAELTIGVGNLDIGEGFYSHTPYASTLNFRARDRQVEQMQFPRPCSPTQAAELLRRMADNIERRWPAPKATPERAMDEIYAEAMNKHWLQQVYDEARSEIRDRHADALHAKFNDSQPVPKPPAALDEVYGQ